MSTEANTYGSDLVVDVLLRMGIDHMTINPSATLRGLHDTIVNTEAGSLLNLILCCHEEIAVAIAHGYAKASGKPMAAAVGNIVGLQHASMAVYNAWSDRVPVLILSGAGPLDAATRRPHVDWVHATIDQGRILSDVVKWSDQPLSAESLIPSLLRAYRLATTKPKAPVHLALDTALQEREVRIEGSPLADGYAEGLHIHPSHDDISQVVERLAMAERPVIMVGRVEDGAEAVASLAELLRAPVIDVGQRLGIPWGHELDLSDSREVLLPLADLVLSLEVKDLYGRLQTAPDSISRATQPITAGDAVIIRLGLDELVSHGYGQFQYQPADVDVVADPDIALVAILDALKDRHDSNRWGAREDWWSAACQPSREGWRQEIERSWDSSPISLPRVAHELDSALGDRDVLLAHNQLWPWPNRIWKRPTMRFLGLLQFAAVALGYGPGVATGAGIAAKKTGETVVCIDGDGDFLYTPSALWTAANQKVPVLFVVLNNSAYGVDIHHQYAIAKGRGRSTDNPIKGLEFDDPAISFSDIARGFGVYTDNAVRSPEDLPPVFGRALQHIDSGAGPALVEVITER